MSAITDQLTLYPYPAQNTQGIQDKDYSGRLPCAKATDLIVGTPKVLSEPKWFGPPANPVGWIKNETTDVIFQWRSSTWPAPWSGKVPTWCVYKWMVSGGQWGIGLVDRYYSAEVVINSTRNADGSFTGTPGPWPSPPDPNPDNYKILRKFWPASTLGGQNELNQNGYCAVEPIYGAPNIYPNEVPECAVFTQTVPVLNTKDYINNNIPNSPGNVVSFQLGTYKPKIFAYINGHVPAGKGGNKPTANDYTPVPASDPVWQGKSPKDAGGIAVGTLTLMLPGNKSISVPFSTGASSGLALDSGQLSVHIKTDSVNIFTRQAGAYGYDRLKPFADQKQTAWKTGVEISFANVYTNNAYDQRKKEVILHIDGLGIGSHGCISISQAAAASTRFRDYLDNLYSLMKKYCGPSWNGFVDLEVAVGTPGVEYYSGRAGKANTEVSWGYGGEAKPGPRFNENYFLPENTLGPEWVPNSIAAWPDSYPVAPVDPDLRMYFEPEVITYGRPLDDGINWLSTNNVSNTPSDNETIYKWQDGYLVQTTRAEEMSQPLGSILAFGGTPGDPWPEGLPNNFFNQNYTNTQTNSILPIQKIQHINRRLD